MAAVRRNILDSTQDRERFIDACIALKLEDTGISTDQLGIGAGPLANSKSLSLWDLFVIWHMWAMQQTSVDGARNAAHVGPVFLPWHRWYLLLLELQMQRVLGLGRDDFGLPYWDWAADGETLTPTQQRNSAVLWGHVGGNGQPGSSEVTDGPFTYSSFPVNVEQAPGGQMRATDRGLRRQFGLGVSRLPREQDVEAALAEPDYDEPDYDSGSDGFRNLVEGWLPRSRAPATHNRVHVWIGGDMAPGTSPNDPLFFLNHCNVDRIWNQWQQTNPQASYLPTGRSNSTADPLYRQRENDPLYSILTRGETQIRAMVDVSQFYSYG